MISVGQILKSARDSAERMVLTVLINGMINRGQGDVRSPLLVQPPGVDSNPIPGKRATYIKSGVVGKYYVLGTINTKGRAEVGEIRILSTDENDVEQISLHLKNDGTALFGTSVTPSDYDNYAVKFNQLKTEFDKLKDDHNELVQKWNSFCQAYVPGGPSSLGTPASLVASEVLQNTSDIDNAKNSKIKFCD